MLKTFILFIAFSALIYAEDKPTAPAVHVLTDHEKYEIAMAFLDAKDALAAAKQSDQIAMDKSNAADAIVTKYCGDGAKAARDNKGDVICVAAPPVTTKAEPAPVSQQVTHVTNSSNIANVNGDVNIAK